MRSVRLVVVLSLLLSSGWIFAGGIEGTVIEVADGDTLTVVDSEKRRHRIRLVGIDAPEMKQVFGPESKRHLSDLVLNRAVVMVDKKQDGNGHDIAKLMVSDPNCNHPACTKIHDVGQMQLMAGMAWWVRGRPYEQSDSDRGYYEFDEFEARAKLKGLWRDDHAVPPWEWRKRETKSWKS